MTSKKIDNEIRRAATRSKNTMDSMAAHGQYTPEDNGSGMRMIHHQLIIASAYSIISNTHFSLDASNLVCNDLVMDLITHKMYRKVHGTDAECGEYIGELRYDADEAQFMYPPSSEHIKNYVYEDYYIARSIFMTVYPFALWAYQYAEWEKAFEPEHRCDIDISFEELVDMSRELTVERYMVGGEVESVTTIRRSVAQQKKIADILNEDMHDHMVEAFSYSFNERGTMDVAAPIR